MIKIILNEKVYNYFIRWRQYYCMKDMEQFKEYFFGDFNNSNIKLIIPENKDNEDNEDKEEYNIKIFDIQDIKEEEYNNNKINMMLCVENCAKWKHYEHYNKYKDYGNKNIQIYFYNHKIRIEETEDRITIPMIYIRMEYYNRNNNKIIIKNNKEFEERKDCLITTKLNNLDKKKINTRLKKVINIDSIENYKERIGNKSCYNSEELIELYNEYKFVILCENSITDGYITEKIFNGLFARTIPIYYGTKTVNNFINRDSIIYIENVDDLENVKKEILELKNNKEKYNEKLNKSKINPDYNNENYKERLINFINKKLNKH